MYVEYVQAHPVVSLQLGTTFWASHFLLEKSTVVLIAFDTGYWPTSCNKLINILISGIMYILVVSIFDGVLGLSLLITLSALLSMEGVKGKVYFRCRSWRCSLGVWGRYRRYIDCTFFTFFLLCCWCWFTTSRNIVFCLLDAFCV